MYFLGRKFGKRLTQSLLKGKEEAAEAIDLLRNREHKVRYAGTLMWCQKQVSRAWIGNYIPPNSITSLRGRRLKVGSRNNYPCCMFDPIFIIWVRSRRCGCLVTWFCYRLIAKPGNRTTAPSWSNLYNFVFRFQIFDLKQLVLRQQKYIVDMERCFSDTEMRRYREYLVERSARREAALQDLIEGLYVDLQAATQKVHVVL